MRINSPREFFREVERQEQFWVINRRRGVPVDFDVFTYVNAIGSGGPDKILANLRRPNGEAVQLKLVDLIKTGMFTTRQEAAEVIADHGRRRRRRR